MAVISRIVFILVYAVLFFPRIDYTLLPGPTGELYVWDTGFVSYIALLRMVHCRDQTYSLLRACSAAVVAPSCLT